MAVRATFIMERLVGCRDWMDLTHKTIIIHSHYHFMCMHIDISLRAKGLYVVANASLQDALASYVWT